MKRSARQCRARRRVRLKSKALRWPTPTSSARLCGLLALIGLLSGCALSSQYRDAVRQHDDLVAKEKANAGRISQLEAGSVSLESELAQAYEQVEDFRIENAHLSDQLVGSQGREAALSTELKNQSIELLRSQSDLDNAKQEVSQLTDTYGELMVELEGEISTGRIQIDQLREGVRVAVSDDVLFESGSASIDSQGREVVQKISAQLASMDHAIEVQGHTDDRLVSRSLSVSYPSNWELAAARAAAVIRLMEQEGISSDRLTLTSFSSHRPMADNNSAEGRSTNRRIEIRLRPQDRETVNGDVSTSGPPESGP